MTYFLVFGDSTVYGAWDKAKGGWTNRLRKYVDKSAIPGKKFDLVYNLGISGHTTRQWLTHFEAEYDARAKEATQYKEKTIVLLCTGGNDSAYLSSTKNNCIPINEFRENVKKLIRLAKTRAKYVFWLSGHPLKEKVKWTSDMTYTDNFVFKYNKVAKAVCAEEKIKFIDVYGKLKKSKNWLCSDNLHLNERGHKIIFETVKDFLMKNRII